MSNRALRSRVIRLAHARPELRRHLLPLLKQASLSYKKERIDIPTAGGGVVTVDAVTYGSWAIYKNFSGSGWAVSLTQTGQAATTRPRTLKEARAYLDAPLERVPSLAIVTNESEVLQHRDVFNDLRKNPPGAGPRPMSVDEKREEVEKWLIAAGLVSMGKRSGKSGEFYALRGDTPTASIAVGRNSLMLNKFNMEDERWGMYDEALISKVTPEQIALWVEFLKKSPTRKQVRSERSPYSQF